MDLSRRTINYVQCSGVVQGRCLGDLEGGRPYCFLETEPLYKLLGSTWEVVFPELSVSSKPTIATNFYLHGIITLDLNY